jgi:hypothetical protein
LRAEKESEHCKGLMAVFAYEKMRVFLFGKRDVSVEIIEDPPVTPAACKYPPNRNRSEHGGKAGAGFVCLGLCDSYMESAGRVAFDPESSVRRAIPRPFRAGR